MHGTSSFRFRFEFPPLGSTGSRKEREMKNLFPNRFVRILRGMLSMSFNGVDEERGDGG